MATLIDEGSEQLKEFSKEVEEFENFLSLDEKIKEVTRISKQYGYECYNEEYWRDVSPLGIVSLILDIHNLKRVEIMQTLCGELGEHELVQSIKDIAEVKAKRRS